MKKLIEAAEKLRRPKVKFYRDTNVPVVDVRDGEPERILAKQWEKNANGKQSKYIPNRQFSRY